MAQHHLTSGHAAGDTIITATLDPVAPDALALDHWEVDTAARSIPMIGSAGDGNTASGGGLQPASAGVSTQLDLNVPFSCTCDMRRNAERFSFKPYFLLCTDEGLAPVLHPM